MPTPYHAAGFPFRFGPGACCCPCYEYEDDFNRADSPDIGGSWIDCDTLASIDSARLKIEDGGRVVLEEMQAPVDKEVGIMYVECEVSVGTSPPVVHVGTKYIIRAFDGSNAIPCGSRGNYWIEATIISAAEVRLQLYSSDGPIGGYKAFDPAAPTFTMELCVSKYMVAASTVAVANMWTCPGGEYGVSGRYFALEVADGDGWIHWAKYSDHYDNNATCPQCPRSCCCPCIEDTADRATRRLTATIVASSAGGDSCSDMNGTSIELECDGIDFECCNWVNNTAYLEFNCKDEDGAVHGPYGLRFNMLCMGDECSDYIGYLYWGPSPAYQNDSYCLNEGDSPLINELQARTAIVENCDCSVDGDPDAIDITFGPYSLSSNPSILDPACFCCGEFYIVVTS